MRRLELLASFGGDLEGAELGDPRTGRFALIHRDTGGCPWRWTRFDKDGFLGHECADSALDAFDAAVTEGFVKRASGSLDAMSALSSFYPPDTD